MRETDTGGIIPLWDCYRPSLREYRVNQIYIGKLDWTDCKDRFGGKFLPICV